MSANQGSAAILARAIQVSFVPLFIEDGLLLCHPEWEAFVESGRAFHRSFHHVPLDNPCR